VVYGFYFLTVLPPVSPDVLPNQVVLFTVLLVPLILFFIVRAIVAVVTDRRSEVEGDERDRLVELKGIRNGAYVLGTGTFAAIACALLADGNFWFLHVLFASLVISELVESAIQLCYYRRGV
jgi:hypothetical protein